MLDVRANKDFSGGHIVDALNIPYEKLSGRITELDKHKKPVGQDVMIELSFDISKGQMLDETGKPRGESTTSYGFEFGLDHLGTSNDPQPESGDKKTEGIETPKVKESKLTESQTISKESTKLDTGVPKKTHFPWMRYSSLSHRCSRPGKCVMQMTVRPSRAKERNSSIISSSVAGSSPEVASSSRISRGSPSSSAASAARLR